MKRIILTVMVCLPLMCMAQNTWEKPTSHVQNNQEKKTLFQIKKKTDDSKYLKGAIPLIDDKIVFTLDKDVPGKSASEIYDLVYQKIDSITQSSNQMPESQIAVVNKQEHIIAARLKEWLIFQNTALSLDRTEFSYTLIANCTDNHLNLTMSRMSFAYEMDRDFINGIKGPAEEFIGDDIALTKNGTKLAKYYGKFRKKTIDRKDNIFETIINALK